MIESGYCPDSLFLRKYLLLSISAQIIFPVLSLVCLDTHHTPLSGDAHARSCFRDTKDPFHNNTKIQDNL